jgi:dipeptidyl aminopeptidase/acylaminoacyl peptidase
MDLLYLKLIYGDSEGEAGGAYYSSDYIIDTLNAYSALQNSDFVNPNRIGLWGHSMAGNVTFRSLAVKQDIPAVVIWAGAGYTYEDLTAYRINDNSYRAPTQNTERARKRQLLMDTYGSFDPTSDFWKKVPGTNYLGGVKSSIEIHHAVNDDVVGIDYSRNLMTILDKTGIPHQLFEYQSGGHNISGSSFITAMQRTVEFFKKELQ